MEFRYVYIISLIFFEALLLSSCEKETSDSKVETTEIVKITTSSVIVRGFLSEVEKPGSGEYGFVFSTHPNPVFSTARIITGTPGNPIHFCDTIDGLWESTRYYLKAYILNAGKVVYGKELEFSTLQSIYTYYVFSITPTSAKGSGQVPQDYVGGITEKGLCWNIVPNPTTDNFSSPAVSGLDDFTCIMNQLTSDTKYYVRAYAKTENGGILYGNEISFKTHKTNAIVDADSNYYEIATIENKVWMTENLRTTRYQDGSSIDYFSSQYGWTLLNTGAYCYYDNDKVNSYSYGALYNWYSVTDARNICPSGWRVPFLSDFEELLHHLGTDSTLYYSALIQGGSSGFEGVFGGEQFDYFEFIGEIGNFWTASSRANLNNAAYYLEIDFRNTVALECTGYSAGFSVRCIKGESLQITTMDPYEIKAYTAKCDGIIPSSGNNAVLKRGFCWSNFPLPTIHDSHSEEGAGAGEFSGNISCLCPNSVYYVRAYASTEQGTYYGNQVQFTSDWSEVTVYDVSGNRYNTLKIGNQTWMANNLKTTLYSDGAPIANVWTDSAWANTITGAYCTCDNNTSNTDTYGLLYNGYVLDVPAGICPQGWHVPTCDEWNELAAYLGGESIAGGKMKETGTFHWHAPNSFASNSSGFSALPGGNRASFGDFWGFQESGYWWASTGLSIKNYAIYDIWYGAQYLSNGSSGKNEGFSIRCLKNSQ